MGTENIYLFLINRVPYIHINITMNISMLLNFFNDLNFIVVPLLSIRNVHQVLDINILHQLKKVLELCNMFSYGDLNWVVTVYCCISRSFCVPSFVPKTGRKYSCLNCCIFVYVGLLKAVYVVWLLLSLECRMLTFICLSICHLDSAWEFSMAFKPYLIFILMIGLASFVSCFHHCFNANAKTNYPYKIVSPVH